MVVDGHALAVLALVVTVLFALVIVAGSAGSRRRQARRADGIDAATVLAQRGVVPDAGPLLLYGVWQTSVADVQLLVRDRHDVEVGTISQHISGTTITVHGERYDVIATSSMAECCELVAATAAGSPAANALCKFESRGWFGRQVGRYALAGEVATSQVLTIHARWSVPWRRMPLPICRGAATVGQFLGLGSAAFDTGRAVILPPGIPLPTALFMLWKGAGTRLRSASS